MINESECTRMTIRYYWQHKEEFDTHHIYTPGEWQIVKLHSSAQPDQFRVDLALDGDGSIASNIHMGGDTQILLQETVKLQEVERLKAKVEEYQSRLFYAEKKIVTLEAENQRLKRELDACMSSRVAATNKERIDD